MKTKFKVGQKVKMIRQESPEAFHARPGCIGEITKIFKKQNLMLVRFTFGEERCWFDEVEPVTSKRGRPKKVIKPDVIITKIRYGDELPKVLITKTYTLNGTFTEEELRKILE